MVTVTTLNCYAAADIQRDEDEQLLLLAMEIWKKDRLEYFLGLEDDKVNTRHWNVGESYYMFVMKFVMKFYTQVSFANSMRPFVLFL